MALHDTRICGSEQVRVDLKPPGRSEASSSSRGRDAFAARALLARKAEKSPDIQFYTHRQDTVGGLLTYEVLRAADRRHPGEDAH